MLTDSHTASSYQFMTAWHVRREANASVSSRCARPADLQGVSELVAGTTSAAEFAADFGCAMERNMAAVSLWQVCYLVPLLP
jgi:hypothetical protein